MEGTNRTALKKSGKLEQMARKTNENSRRTDEMKIGKKKEGHNNTPQGRRMGKHEARKCRMRRSTTPFFLMEMEKK